MPVQCACTYYFLPFHSQPKLPKIWLKTFVDGFFSTSNHTINSSTSTCYIAGLNFWPPKTGLGWMRRAFGRAARPRTNCMHMLRVRSRETPRDCDCLRTLWWRAWVCIVRNFQSVEQERLSKGKADLDWSKSLIQHIKTKMLSNRLIIHSTHQM